METALCWDPIRLAFKHNHASIRKLQTFGSINGSKAASLKVSSESPLEMMNTLQIECKSSKFPTWCSNFLCLPPLTKTACWLLTGTCSEHRFEMWLMLWLFAFLVPCTIVNGRGGFWHWISYILHFLVVQSKRQKLLTCTTCSTYCTAMGLCAAILGGGSPNPTVPELAPKFNSAMQHAKLTCAWENVRDWTKKESGMNKKTNNKHKQHEDFFVHPIFSA